MELVKRVKKFIRKQWDGKSPWLLGYSGGPDSKALLYCLLELNIPLHLAHVDHGWREESKREAGELAEEAKKLNVPFHCLRLEEKPARSWEDFGRKKRLAFFRSILEKISFQALVLAHHQDDVAETVLKRVLEGAHLPHLGGMSEVGQLAGFLVFRPLLTVRKKELLDYLERRKLIPIQDPSNEDKAFLRARFRQQMLPMLADCLGKEVHENLFLLSERAFELRAYLEKKTEQRWEERREENGGVTLSLEGLERIEARYLVQKLFSSYKLLLARDNLESVLDVSGKEKVSFSIKGGEVSREGAILSLRKLFMENGF